MIFIDLFLMQQETCGRSLFTVKRQNNSNSSKGSFIVGDINEENTPHIE
jgi:hypothetical protein